MTRIIGSLAEVSAGYHAFFCDVWGVIHNGVAPDLTSCSALRRQADAGKPVILLTNSPRPANDVERQIKAIGVPEDCWSSIVTSGDAARDSLFSGEVGTKIFHIGPDAAKGFLQSENCSPQSATQIQCVGLEEAEGIVCTGLFDDTVETPDDYRGILSDAARRGLKLLCANPDFVVDRGACRIYCAGALAALYEELGGTSLMFGKPRSCIYQLAKRQVRSLLGQLGEARILCIGDGLQTDVRGAESQSLDCLFVTGGLAAEETGTVMQPNPEMLKTVLAAAGLRPPFSIGHLR